jgi:hypothetical protein
MSSPSTNSLDLRRRSSYPRNLLHHSTSASALGRRGLIRQNEYARTNGHDLAVVRGTDLINRLLRLTGVEDILVLVDDHDVCAATAHALTVPVRPPTAL